MNANVVEPALSTLPARWPSAAPRRSFHQLAAAPVIQQAQSYLEAGLGTAESRELILGLLLALMDQREAVHLVAQFLAQKSN